MIIGLLLLLCMTLWLHLSHNGYCNALQFPYARLENDTLILSGHRHRVYGNYLSLYYGYRGMAKFLGVCFENDRIGLPPFLGDDEWLNYLPRHYCAPKPSLLNNTNSIEDVFSHIIRNAEIIKETSESCKGKFQFPHECLSFQLHVREEMSLEIKHAINLHRQKQNISLSVVGGQNGKKTSVIYMRCKEKESIMSHPMYGPVAFSFYKPAANYSDHILFVARAAPGVCLDILESAVLYLRKIKPVLTYEFQRGSAFEAFATLVLAKRLFIEKSSFGFMAALANENIIHSPMQHMNSFPPLKNFIWSENSESLLPSVGRQKLDIKTKILGSEDVRKILDWLNEN